VKPLILACIVAAILVPPMKAQEPADVTLVQLIANPDRFDGKLIRVIGFYGSNLKEMCSIFIVRITRMPY